MTDVRQGVYEEEPMGIVISRGSRTELPPRVWAYVWGQAPEAASEAAPVAAQVAEQPVDAKAA